MMSITKVFWSGRSQAVLIPEESRVDGDEERTRRQGHAVVLEPIPKDWEWLADVMGPVDDDFAESAAERSPQQSRPALDSFD